MTHYVVPLSSRTELECASICASQPGCSAASFDATGQACQISTTADFPLSPSGLKVLVTGTILGKNVFQTLPCLRLTFFFIQELEMKSRNEENNKRALLEFSVKNVRNNVAILIGQLFCFSSDPKSMMTPEFANDVGPDNAIQLAQMPVDCGGNGRLLGQFKLEWNNTDGNDRLRYDFECRKFSEPELTCTSPETIANPWTDYVNDGGESAGCFTLVYGICLESMVYVNRLEFPCQSVQRSECGKRYAPLNQLFFS